MGITFKGLAWGMQQRQPCLAFCFQLCEHQGALHSAGSALYLPTAMPSAAQAGLTLGFSSWDVTLVPNPAGLDVSGEAATTSQAREPIKRC